MDAEVEVKIKSLKMAAVVLDLQNFRSEFWSRSPLTLANHGNGDIAGSKRSPMDGDIITTKRAIFLRCLNRGSKVQA